MSVGTEYEGGADRLWVAGGGTGVARAYDATSGAILETYTLPGGFLNDVAVTGDAAYVTDSNVQQLHVIPLGLGGALAAPGDAYALPLTGDIAYVDGFNVNGIVAVRGMLVVVQSNTGLLFAVDPATGVTTAIDTGGYSVASGDGLYVQGSTLYVVRNFLNTIAVLRLSPDLASATLVGEITSPDLAIPTTAIVSNGRLWAANSRFDTPMTPDTEYWITQLPTMP
jgi:sugar lactone lactonase YvrE